jgi:hypothetical protein
MSNDTNLVDFDEIPWFAAARDGDGQPEEASMAWAQMLYKSKVRVGQSIMANHREATELPRWSTRRSGQCVLLRFG